jgi:hypothetical protein
MKKLMMRSKFLDASQRQWHYRLFLHSFQWLYGQLIAMTLRIQGLWIKSANLGSAPPLNTREPIEYE